MNLSKKQLLDILCFIVGPMIIAYNLLDFRFGQYLRHDAFRYYYMDDTQIFIAIGIALVCWGFLRMYWKKNEGKVRGQD